MVSFAECRSACRKISCPKYMDISRFNRIPMHYFQFFISDTDPLQRAVNGEFAQIDIVMVFMVINQLPFGLVASWYAAGGKDADTVMSLLSHLHKVDKLVNNAPLVAEYGLTVLLGYHYAYHLDTKTLRYADNTIVINLNMRRKGILFDPNHPLWRRNLRIKQEIQNGQLFLDLGDRETLEVVREAMKDTLKTGRMKNK